MTKTITAIAVAILALGLIAPNAQADLVYVGMFTPDHPSNPTSELANVNHLIGMSPGDEEDFGSNYFVRADSGMEPLPAALAVIDVLQSGTYVLGKYDAGNAGAYVWYVNGPNNNTVPSTDPDSDKYGLSHTTVFSADEFQDAPDGGMTLILLGGALVGLEALRRRLSA